MSCEALWSINFKASNQDGGGGGVIVFETERAFGGDSSFTYIGGYQLQNNRFTANLRIKRFNNILDSLYRDEFTMALSGDYSDENFTLTGSPDDDPSFVITAEVTRVAELP